MEPRIIFSIILLVMFVFIILLQKKFGLLYDQSSQQKKAYSFSRVQLTWWTFIILSSIISIIFTSRELPELYQSTLILLGIGSLTTVSARIIDISDDANVKTAQAAGNILTLNRNLPGEGFFLDILTDQNGVSIHRLQAVAFNMVIGLWFLYKVFVNIKIISIVNNIMPDIGNNNLILLGLSAGTYVALKSAENK